MHFHSVFSYVATVAMMFFWTAAASQAKTETPHEVLETKAQRFYSFQEWESALAMYELMLMQRSDDIATYSHAITVDGILERSDEQMRFVERTQKEGIALKDLFLSVKHEAFALGKPAVYEHLLYNVRTNQPWLKRSIDLQLIRYYASRNNAPRMIALADTLLAVNPSDTEILQIKARGHMLQSDYPAAIGTYKEILSLDAVNVDACLNIGSYYYSLAVKQKLNCDSPEAAEARNYLQRADELQPSPHIKEMLNRLISPAKKNAK